MSAVDGEELPSQEELLNVGDRDGPTDEDRREFADPQMPIVIAVTKDRLDARFQRWTNKPQTWGEFRGSLLDHKHWRFAAKKEEADAFVGVEQLTDDNRGNKQVKAV